ncbi:MAG: hypothetical protein JW883_06515 [Deltaproteobacteria bacterium]|nr:hypothetical protein [Deltaproteobacteria bacterium]
MKRRVGRIAWELKFSLALIVSSFILYFIHYTCFRDLHHIWLWGFTSLSFLPISVLLVTVFINRLLGVREMHSRLEKLNMLIGAFFSNTGTELLSRFSAWDPQADYLRNHLGRPDVWSKLTPEHAKQILSAHPYKVSVRPADLQQLKDFLTGKTDFLLRLLENPNLLEHETFTELLRAVFHLAEELSCRKSVLDLPGSDVRHLMADVKRCYGFLVRKWVSYLAYLRREYPYLFSLAVRTNPFDGQASVVVT